MTIETLDVATLQWLNGKLNSFFSCHCTMYNLMQIGDCIYDGRLLIVYKPTWRPLSPELDYIHADIVYSYP